MTDRELLNEVKEKLEALSPRVDALEIAAIGSVSHDEVTAVVDTENLLESRVSALENIFNSDNTSNVSEPLTFVVSNVAEGAEGEAESAEVETEVNTNHEIS